MSLSSDEANAKRQRVSRACDLCRKKKIKCDGLTPVCTNCQTLSLSCTYKDTTKKRGPPKGYIEAIENRLHKLEGYLKDMVKEDDPKRKELLMELESPLETPCGEQINSRPQRRQRRRPQSSSSTPTRIEPRLRESSVDDPLSPTLFDSPSSLGHHELPETPASPTHSVDDSTGQLSMDENGQVRFLGKSSGFYLLQNSRTYQNGAFHFSGYSHKLSSKITQKKTPPDTLDLPPKDLSEHLIKLYFTHFYPLLPMFYKRRLVSSFTPLEPISPLLLNAIYAVASRVTPDERVRSDTSSPDTAGDVFFERAKCLLDDYYDTPRISTVQALLLMSIHQMGAMKPARAWLYSGMAFRMAQDLGLNRNCEHWNITPEDRERRKRVFWCCFIVDRLVSAVYGRSANFEERDCDVPFPSVDDDENITPTNVDSTRPPASLLELFIQYIKVCDILGHVLKNIYYAKARLHTSSQHIDHILTTLHRQLTQWHSNLPDSLQYKLPNTQNGERVPDPPSSICQLHMIYYTTVILLHRSFIPGPTQTNLPISLPSYRICESAANSILDIVNIMLGENHLRYSYNFTVYFVFTAGIIFIKLASSDDADHAFDAKININRTMRALDDLEVTWLNAARCCNILGELAGLRDINLECDEFVPRKIAKKSPPPSIAVPNSPELNASAAFNSEGNDDKSRNASRPAAIILTEDRPFNHSYTATFSDQNKSQIPISSVRQSNNQNNSSNNNKSSRSASIDQLHSNFSSPSTPGFSNTTPTMDPFAAPGIIPGTAQQQQQQQQFDPLGTAFWGMPSSLDTDEWNTYFGNQINPQQQQQQSDTQQLSSLLSAGGSLTSSSFLFNSPPSDYQQRRGKEDTSTKTPTSMNMFSTPITAAESTNSMPMSIDLPNSPSQSVLLGFMDNNNGDVVTSPSPIQQNDRVNSTSNELNYW